MVTYNFYPKYLEIKNSDGKIELIHWQCFAGMHTLHDLLYVYFNLAISAGGRSKDDDIDYVTHPTDAGEFVINRIDKVFINGISISIDPDARFRAISDFYK